MMVAPETGFKGWKAMLISQKMADAINAQIGREFAASLQYVAISHFFAGQNLPGFATRFGAQASEEHEHAMKFVAYLTDAGAPLAIPTIAAPKSSFGSSEEAVKLALDWELEVTAQINGLVDLAIGERDHLSQNLLAWFVTEQLEEVSTMETLLGMVRRAGESGLLLVDSYLAGASRAGASSESPSS